MSTLSKNEAIEIVKSSKFYYKASLHYNSWSDVYCDYCEKEITGGCVGKNSGEDGVDICLKCVSDLCSIISRRSNSSSSDTNSNTSSSDANTNTNTNTNTIDDVRRQM
jgi:hypothetical protein